MNDDAKTERQLRAEVAALHRRVAELENAATQRHPSGKSLPSSSDSPAADPADRAVKLLRAKYPQLIEGSRDGYALLEMNGAFVFCNAAYCTMLGYSLEELRQLNYRDLTPEKWVALDQQHFEEMEAHGYCALYEKEYRRRDGTVFPVEIRSYLDRDVDGAPSGMWSVVRDITESKQAEEARRQQAEQLRTHNEELERFNRLAVGRELRIVELEHELNELHGKPGKIPPHRLDEVPPPLLPEHSDPAPASPAEMRILVVDDQPEVMQGTVRLLKKAGYTVDQAGSGAEALESARLHCPNLLLLDQDMPGMDGLEVCRRIRRDPALADVFVIFVSGVNVASEEQVEGLESGADGYITRPISNRELLARVDAYVRILFLNRSLRQHVKELKQAGEAAHQSRLALLNLMEEAVVARDRAETVSQELQKEMVVRMAHEREIERLNRLYITLSQVNQTIVRTVSREELLESICRIAIDYAGYKLAWIGRIDPETQQVMPLASAGKAAAYVDEIKVYADEREEGQGPGGMCIREQKPSVLNDFLDHPAGRPWHEAAQAHELRSVAAFPIHFQGRVWGALSVYDGEAGVFKDQEIALLVEATKDISFALENLEREEQRQRAEAALKRQAADLQARNEKLTRFNRVAVDRELRMIELKQEVNALCRATGQPEPYAAKTVAELAQTSPAPPTQAAMPNPKP